MPINQQGDENEVPKPDEDAQFEQENELTMSALPDESEAAPKQSMLESTLPAKEDTLGNSDFPPLSEKDKQPKLQDEERIKELNRKTSLGD